MVSWDRSHDWVVQRYYNDLTRVTILLQHGAPTVAELFAIRQCLPRFRDVPPAELRTMFDRATSLPLGEMPTREARELLGAARTAGLEVVADVASFISYVPFDRTTGCAWILENDAESRSVAEAMIAEGVPIQDVAA